MPRRCHRRVISGGGKLAGAVDRGVRDAGDRGRAIGVDQHVELDKAVAPALVIAGDEGRAPTIRRRYALRRNARCGGRRHLRCPAESLALVGLDRNTVPTQTFSQEFPGGNYSGPNFGVSSIGSNALAPGVVGAAPTTQTKLLAVVSSASIQLPDPLAYRRDWQKYHIRLSFGDPPQVETREIAAPAPPPQL
jgi:hypothetical protein